VLPSLFRLRDFVADANILSVGLIGWAVPKKALMLQDVINVAVLQLTSLGALVARRCGHQ
jgi:hypothetical protein